MKIEIDGPEALALLEMLRDEEKRCAERARKLMAHDVQSQRANTARLQLAHSVIVKLDDAYIRSAA
jgi:hypothetical protein